VEDATPVGVNHDFNADAGRQVDRQGADMEVTQFRIGDDRLDAVRLEFARQHEWLEPPLKFGKESLIDLFDPFMLACQSSSLDCMLATAVLDGVDSILKLHDGPPALRPIDTRKVMSEHALLVPQQRQNQWPSGMMHCSSPLSEIEDIAG
jgi:hypothetical protein